MQNVNGTKYKMKNKNFPQKIQHRVTILFSDPISAYMSKIHESKNINLYTFPHWALFTIQNVEAIETSVIGGMHKQNVTGTCNEILLRFKKKGDSDPYYKHRMNLEDLIISEISPHKRTNIAWFHLQVWTNFCWWILHSSVNVLIIAPDYTLKVAKMIHFVLYFFCYKKSE